MAVVEEDSSVIEYRAQRRWLGTTQEECLKACDHRIMMGNDDG